MDATRGQDTDWMGSLDSDNFVYQAAKQRLSKFACQSEQSSVGYNTT